MTTPFETLEAFRAAVVILEPDEAERLRASFVKARLDRQLESQAADALALRRFGNGLAYTGYLWDFLSDKEPISEEELWRRVERCPSILAMWDLHSTERVRTSDYFKLPKGTVLRGDPNSMRRGMQYLPEDLYVFDDTCDWTGALTHERINERRYCVWSGRHIEAAMPTIPLST